MPLRMIVLIGYLILCPSCYAEAGRRPMLKLPAQRSETASSVAALLCDRLSEIREVPFKDEPVSDEVYNGFMKVGKATVPCLIDKLDDVTTMRDPRSTPKYSNFKVGDMAYILLVRVTGIPFEQMLPEEVNRRMKEEGVYAYFEFVERESNRQLLKDNWRSWANQNL